MLLTAQRYRAAFDLGPGYKLAFVPENYGPDFADFQSGLKIGTTANFDLQYFQGNKGFGFKYIQFNASNKLTKAAVAGNSALLSKTTVNYWEQVRVEYLGLHLAYKKQIGNSPVTAISTIGFGRILYSKNAVYVNDTINYSAEPWGIDWSLGLDYKVSKHFAIGIAINNLIGKATNQTDNRPDKYQTYNIPESLTRLDLVLGIRLIY